VDSPFKTYLELGPCLQMFARVCGVSGSRWRATQRSVYRQNNRKLPSKLDRSLKEALCPQLWMSLTTAGWICAGPTADPLRALRSPLDSI